MYSIQPHLLDSVKLELKRASASLSVILGDLIKVLQPLDIAVNKSFKGRVLKHWETWIASKNHSYTKNRNSKIASYEKIVPWVSQALREVSSDTIKSGFSKVEIIPNISIEENHDVLNDEDTELNEEFLHLFNLNSENSEFLKALSMSEF